MALEYIVFRHEWGTEKTFKKLLDVEFAERDPMSGLRRLQVGGVKLKIKSTEDY